MPLSGTCCDLVVVQVSGKPSIGPEPDHVFPIDLTSDFSEEIYQRQNGLLKSENTSWAKEITRLYSKLSHGFGLEHLQDTVIHIHG